MRRGAAGSAGPPAKALPPAEATAWALRLLEERGFAVRARNTRGDSVYLTTAGGEEALRVSNHARTPKQRRNHPEVATSLILRGPKTAVQVEAMVTTAVRDFLATRAVRAREPEPQPQPSAVSRK